MLSLLRAAFTPFSKSTFVSRSSPDEIIGAAIVESFSSNFHQWKAEGGDKRPLPVPLEKMEEFPSKEVMENRRRQPIFRHFGLNLFNLEKKIEFKYGFIYTARDNDNANPWYRTPMLCEVNGIALAEHVALTVMSRYKEVAKVHRHAKDVADKIKTEMERSEAAWNLAERLLNKKRLSNGALVPAESFCETCVRHDGKPIETPGGVIYLCSGCEKKRATVSPACVYCNDLKCGGRECSPPKEVRKCSPSTGSSGSAKLTAVRSTAPAVALSVRRKTTRNTSSSIASTEPQESTQLGEAPRDFSPLLQPLSMP